MGTRAVGTCARLRASKAARAQRYGNKGKSLNHCCLLGFWSVKSEKRRPGEEASSREISMR